MQQTFSVPLLHIRFFGLLIALCLSASVSRAQSARPDPQETIFTIVECPPQFPGGPSALQNFLALHLHYPDSAAKANVSGRVFVSFVVEPDGQLTQLDLLKGIGFGCDEEALRVVKAMPHWQPGTQSGRAIRVKYTLPIFFGAR